MANKKTDSSNSPRSDDPVHPTKGGLSAKPITASATAGAEPRLDTRFHRTATGRPGPLQDFYHGMLERGMREELARVTLARKLAALTLRLLKTGEVFDPTQLSRPQN